MQIIVTPLSDSNLVLSPASSWFLSLLYKQSEWDNSDLNNLSHKKFKKKKKKGGGEEMHSASIFETLESFETEHYFC